MKFIDLYHEAVLWACYLENFPDPERFLGIYRLGEKDRLLFDCLGKFFPFDEFYIRGECFDDTRAINDLRLSKKSFLLPWIYRPKGSVDMLCGKQLLCPSADLFILLDNKLEAKNLLNKLRIPTPDWSFINKGELMVEKPMRNSAGGLGIQLTPNNAQEGFFLEKYIQGYKSFGLQFFVCDEIEFVCANEMLYHTAGGQKFTFHSQVNIGKYELPQTLITDCFNCIEYLKGRDYKGLINIDTLIGERGHYLLEINPRGSAFLPAFFAASALGWTNFITYTKKEIPEQDEVVLLDFGKSRKVIKKL